MDYIKNYLPKKNTKSVETIFNENILEPAMCKNIIGSSIECKKDVDNIINIENTYQDLEVFKTISEDKSALSLIDSLNRCNTFLGENYLHNIMSQPTSSISILHNRQRINKELLSNRELYKSIKLSFKQLKALEKSVLWIIKEKTPEEKNIINSVYFQNKYLKFLNKNDSVLTAYNYFTIIFAPVYGLLSPVLFLILPYLYLKLFTKLPIKFGQYFNIFKLGIFSGMSLLSGKSGGFPITSILSKVLSFIIYVQNLYNNFSYSKKTNSIINNLHKKVNDIAKFMEISCDLLAKTQKIFNRQQPEYCVELLRHKTFKSSPGIFTNKGIILITYDLLNGNENILKTLEYIGELDFYMSTCSLLEETENQNVSSQPIFSYANYLHTGETTRPVILAKDIWHPCLNKETVVTNSIQLGGNKRNNIIITGPNAGGKSTFIKSITICIVLAQTLGIVPSSRFTLTPFSLVNTYLNIPDCKGKESLFEAEMNRARIHIEKLENLEENKFAFLIMDEIFSSTNPEEGISGGFAICEKLASIKNSINIITTHFTYLTKLKETSDFETYKMPITRTHENDILYKYKLVEGVSKQFIALELLRKRGFDNNLVNRAMKIHNKIDISYGEDINTEDINTEDINTEDINTEDINTEDTSNIDDVQSSNDMKSINLDKDNTIKDSSSSEAVSISK